MSSPTLIVIDVQQALDDPGYGQRNNPEAERNIARVIEAWRKRGAPLIHVRHESEGLFAAGTETTWSSACAQRVPGPSRLSG
jgi:nicotinamidase-related amidase